MKNYSRIRKLAGLKESRGRGIPSVIRPGTTFETVDGNTVVVKDIYLTGAPRKPVAQVVYDLKTIKADGSENPWRRDETIPLDKFSDMIKGKL